MLNYLYHLHLFMALYPFFLSTFYGWEYLYYDHFFLLPFQSFYILFLTISVGKPKNSFVFIVLTIFVILFPFPGGIEHVCLLSMLIVVPFPA